MRKGLIAIAVVLVMILTVAVASSFAYEVGHKKSKGYYKESKSKVESKAHMILKNRGELGLSDEQIKGVKELMLKSKKDSIKQKAEIEIIALDINSKKQDDTMDIEAINALIDKKYELKKEKAKSSVAAYIQLKSILTEEQQVKLKELYKKCKMEKGKSGY